MLFSSYIFLFLYLPIVLGCYYLTPCKLKNFFLLVASLIFYSWGVPTLVGILVLSSIADYFLAKFYSDKTNLLSGSIAFWFGIFINISLLFYFKYSNFFIAEINSILSGFGMTQIIWSNIILPIGISFFTFQKISYLVDVFQRKVNPARNIVNYLLFVSLFPQLIAGPIVKYHDLNDQLVSRKHSIRLFFSGFVRFCIGLGKKVLLADTMGSVADNVFNLEYGQVTTFYAWIGIICYSMQVYFDFSGYSDMAIGLGNFFGFNFQENFNFPYISKNITEFWKRWHISLSTWMKEYLYIPLGGNQAGTLRTYINLWVVFLLSGLWHGASWNFIAWGVFHGVFLSLDKLFLIRTFNSLNNIVKILTTYLIVLNSWVLFRAETLSSAIKYYGKMYGLSEDFKIDNHTYLDQIITNRGLCVLIILLSTTFLTNTRLFLKIMSYFSLTKDNKLVIFIQAVFAISIYILSILSLSATDYNPFIYFKF